MEKKTDVEQDLHERIVKALGVTTVDNVVDNLKALLDYVADLGAVWPDKCKEVPASAWVNAATYGQHATTPFIEGELVKRLHDLRIHPDWQYTAVEHPRKGGYSNPPPGQGWVDNIEHDRGVTRYDNTEDHHFRRLKTDAVKDDIELSELPVMPNRKMTLLEYMKKLRDVFCKDYMPSSTSDRQFNSKPEYVRFVNAIAGLNNGICVYALEDAAMHEDRNAIEKLNKQFGTGFFINADSKSNLIFAMEIDGLRILTCLQTDRTFVTTTRKDGSWQDWSEWTSWLNLPIDRYVLDKILENI